MRKGLLSILMAGVGMLMASCELEMSDNGKLDGFWQLRSVDTLANGASADVRSMYVTWSFQGRLMQVRHVSSVLGVFFDFNHQGDSLYISNPYLSDREVDDVKVTDPRLLQGYGIQKLEEGYRILQLDNNTMKLQSDLVRLTFKKY